METRPRDKLEEQYTRENREPRGCAVCHSFFDVIIVPSRFWTMITIRGTPTRTFPIIGDIFRSYRHSYRHHIARRRQFGGLNMAPESFTTTCMNFERNKN